MRFGRRRFGVHPHLHRVSPVSRHSREELVVLAGLRHRHHFRHLLGARWCAWGGCRRVAARGGGRGLCYCRRCEQRQQDDLKQGAFMSSILSKPSATRQVNDCRSDVRNQDTLGSKDLVLQKVASFLAQPQSALYATRRRHVSVTTAYNSMPRGHAENRNMVFPEQRGAVACYRHEKFKPSPDSAHRRFPESSSGPRPMHRSCLANGSNADQRHFRDMSFENCD